MEISADNVYSWSNWLLLASLIVGVVSTYGVVVSGKIRDEKSKREVARAHETAALAGERAAALQKEAALAKLETERLKNMMAWRRITTAQSQTLVHSLKGRLSEDVWVEYVQNDPEATQFHSDIWETLNAAGIKLHYYSGWERAIGLQITNAESPTGKAIKAAFSNIGINFIDKAEPGLKSAGDKVEIIVGSKPPEFFTSENGPVKVPQ